MTRGKSARLFGLAGCALAAASAAGGCATRAGADATTGTGSLVGRRAPDLTAVDMTGRPVSLASLRGRVVLLDLWASWCEPCKKELPLLDGMAERLKSKGVEVLAVSIDDRRENAARFLEARPRWALTAAHDPTKLVGETWRPEKMPTSYVIDREGIIRHVNAGFEPGDETVIERQLLEMVSMNVIPPAKSDP